MNHITQSPMFNQKFRPITFYIVWEKLDEESFYKIKDDFFNKFEALKSISMEQNKIVLWLNLGQYKLWQLKNLQDYVIKKFSEIGVEASCEKN